MIASPPQDRSPPRQAVRRALAADETSCVEALLVAARLPQDRQRRIEAEAVRLIEAVRAHPARFGGLDTFLAEYRLSSREGVVLMCLAEALLRIPDSETADRLIRDKIGGADWARHLGHSGAALVNASTWALMLTGRMVRLDTSECGGLGLLTRLAARVGDAVVREALSRAMGILGHQFVMGRTIAEALDRAAGVTGYRHSFDMLGEAARTEDAARRYFDSYAAAITAIGQAANGRGPVHGPGISVKLSALFPRFEFAQSERIGAELVPRLGELCRLARDVNIGLTIDAEEADRLEPTLDVMAVLLADPALAGWEGLGLAVQAYQKRAPAVIDWLIERAGGRRLTVRLVKGAYWDSEIKRAQERGLHSYPVFTRKLATDVSYLACARRLFAAGKAIFPQFATHNAHSAAAVIEMAGPEDWEFQRLHGMGDALYAQLVGQGRACRTYAPVGGHADLLPYLVRRLLENGANSSFVNRIADNAVPAARLAADPVEVLAAMAAKPNSRIPLPPNLFGAERPNSPGWDLTDPLAVERLETMLEAAAHRTYLAAPMLGDRRDCVGSASDVCDPADRRRVVGRVVAAGADEVAAAADSAVPAASQWNGLGALARASILERAAEFYDHSAAELIWLAMREAGKTVADAVAEWREAVDYLRFYAAEARTKFAAPAILPAVAGETNRLELRGRGVFVCISPWNFPLAIFTGQVAAALAAGNAVLAKPAPQTPLIAALAVDLLRQAGVPAAALQLLPGDGAVGAALVARPEVAGVAFTGSFATAKAIQRALAAKPGPIVPLIAETGGLNAMIVDSSALTEQVVADVIASAFHSAGQRCSALRVLFLQDEVFAPITAMLAGAARQLAIGDPARLATDIGPVIDSQAADRLRRHAERMATQGRLLFECRLPESCRYGTYVPPMAFVLDDAGALDAEVFGPVLHVVRYSAGEIGRVLAWLAASRFGLTLGIHSRLESFIEFVLARTAIGNVYVNRGMTGAVVGMQPFGGGGLSGTGPKAGGPHTLARFAIERTVTVNIAAAGGNPALLAMDEAQEKVEPVALR